MPQQNTPKYVLGLDVGITSVGWGILDKDIGSVIDAGVRLFEEATAEGNVDRRGHRGGRRLLRRRTHRLERMQRLLKRHGITLPHPSQNSINPYEVRVKGLREKLPNQELAVALLNLTKRRGVDNIDVIADDKEEKRELGETKTALKENAALLQGKFICEIQQERLQSHDMSVRGTHNRFNTKDYLREAEQILTTQGVPKAFKEEALAIIASRRAYYDGPGSESSPTPYGQWFYDDNGILQHIGMIEKMRGKCSVYPEKPRAPKMSYTAELFNFLNQLNNISFGDDQKITPEQKHRIIDEYIENKDSITPRQLAKFLGVTVNDLRGVPTKTKGKDTAYLNPFTGQKKIRKALKDAGLKDAILQDKDLLDNIAAILTDEKALARRKEKLVKYRSDILTDDVITVLAGIDGFTGYHNLSFAAMHEMMDDLWQTSKNQMQILTENNIGHTRYNALTGKRDIPFREDVIYSPVARRAEREAIKVINAVRRKYGELDTIVIEMARDKNSKDQKDRITKQQRRYEEEKKAVKKLAGDRRLTPKQALKLRLYEQQDCKCIYTGERLEIADILRDEHAYEIDHIIPLSISHDDSLANKVLCLHSANQQKGQRTPFAWFASGTAPRSYEDFKKQVLNTHKINRKKREYLLFEADISRYDVQKQFIQRNLVDTRYATRALLNMTTDFMRANNIPTKVHTVRGSVTAAFRKRAGVRKDRDEDFRHHAIDALIVAGIKKLGYLDAMMDVYLTGKSGEEVAVSRRTGEIITPQNEREYFDADVIALLHNLRDGLRERIRYSHKVDRKPNRQISDETIYGVRKIDGKDHIIGKYNDIYSDKDGKAVAELFRKGTAEKKLLMARHDPQTFAVLQKIVDTYKDADNPFARYHQEHGPIRKCGKASGPIVRSLRYDANALGIHMDISHKYPGASKVIKKQLPPFRVDVYRQPNGRYAFLRLTYADVHPCGKGRYCIAPKRYTEEKAARGIGDDATFQFSLYKNDIFGFVKGELDEKIVRLNGVKNYTANTLEYKERDRMVMEKNGKNQKRLVLSVGPSITALRKYNVNVLGYRYRAPQESCQLTVNVL